MASGAFWQETEDWHTAGEPFRIVKDLPVGSLTQGLTVSQQRLEIINAPSHQLDLLRKSLCFEPRGHADMYGGFILPPDDAGALFGVLFWHKDGFSTACGHGTIALGYWAIAHGLAPRHPGGTTDVIIDVPSGRVAARATFDDDGSVKHVDFINVASYQVSTNNIAMVELAGKSIELQMDFSFGGAVFACVNVADLGEDVRIEPSRHQTFINLARQIKLQNANYTHKDKYELASVCFFVEGSVSESVVNQKNVVVYGDGQIDRSPCGSGTCARLAVLLAQGRVNEETPLIHESIVGSRFEAHVVERMSNEGKFPACIPRVRSEARLVGRMNFFIDPTDLIYPGFVLR